MRGLESDWYEREMRRPLLALVVLVLGPCGALQASPIPSPSSPTRASRVAGWPRRSAKQAAVLVSSFPPGTDLCPVTVSKPSVSVLASATDTLLVNRTATAVDVLVDGTVVTP